VSGLYAEFDRVAALAVFVLGLAGGAPGAGRAQDSTQSETAAEGTVMHDKTKRIYRYRIDQDSTVLLRQMRPPGDSVIAIPATTLAWITRRTEEQVLSPGDRGEHVVIGYEDNNLILRFTQRFNLYVLGTLIAVVLVGGGLLLWLWWRLSKEQRRREALAESRRYLAEGREKERKRLAREIHDGPVQDLHGLHMQLKAVPDAPDRLQTVGEELMRVTGELRAMSADLHPPALQRFGLPAALRSHADRLSGRHDDLQIDMDLDEECGPLPDTYALSLFRIAQEAMNNAAQHGHATHVQIRFRCVDHTATLTVRDDGDGFDLPDDWHALAADDHYGLLGMRERAEAIGAELTVESTPGDGTSVRVRGTIATPDERSRKAEPVPA
jgi:signal transduction histidine kinase